MCASVTRTEALCSHLKRTRWPASVARLIAGMSTWRTGTVVRAIVAITAAAKPSCDHQSRAASADVAITNK